MFVGARFLKNVVLVLFLGYSFALELQSEETTSPLHLTTFVAPGKRLKLHVGNVDYPTIRWKFNGTFVSEKCEVQSSPKSSTLICTDMDWSNEGFYECQGITQEGHSEALLAVYVKVVECEKSAKQEEEPAERVMRIREQCFCSGITDKCEMADNLFRRKVGQRSPSQRSDNFKYPFVFQIVTSLLDSNVVPSKWSNDKKSLKYYSLPVQMKGNLLMSYGGFLDIPARDHEGVDNPDVVLQGSEQTLVYYHNRDSEISGELNRKRIPMTEQEWRHLDGSHVTRNIFMTVLSRVKEFYVKSNATGGLESLDIVLDSADYKDHGLGKVTTVEKCACHVGYDGLSCEKCSKKFIRRHAIGLQGVCVSFKETWDKYKRIIAMQKHNDLYNNRLRV